MYYSIKGQVAILEKYPSFLVVLENNGIGYEIAIGESTFLQLKLKDQVKIFTSYIVRENSISLVGFLKESEKKFFETLISVSGVGPKQGLQILSSSTVGNLQKAILEKDSHLLSQVKGIGKKKAEKIIIELQDKIQDVSLDELDNNTPKEYNFYTEALMAMRVLGYQDNIIRNALDQAFKEHKEFESAESLIKITLQLLG